MLRPCTEIWGSVTLRDAVPGIVTYRDVTYVPYQHGAAWGIFDADGQAVEGSVDMHGPNGVPEHQILEWAGQAEAQAEEDVYIYAGRFNPHYGHFLVNTLSRLWPLALAAPPAGRLLFHGGGTPADWFTLPFARESFGALGLGAGDIRRFTVPTRINTLIVPRPCFQEQHFVHRVFAALCHHIGARLLQGHMPRTGLPPVYLSKSGLTSGVGRVVNEAPLEARLRDAGVEIIHPEQLSLAEQITLFVERPAVLGTIGSAFHTSVFAPPHARLLALSPIPGPNSNYLLIDAVNGNNAQYFYADGAALVRPQGDPFITSFQIPEPELAADILLTQLGPARHALRPLPQPAPTPDAPPPHDAGQVQIFSARSLG